MHRNGTGSIAALEKARLAAYVDLSKKLAVFKSGLAALARSRASLGQTPGPAKPDDGGSVAARFRKPPSARAEDIRDWLK